MCLNYKSDTVMEENVSSRHVEAEEKPSKKSKKDCAKGSVAILKESAQLACVSHASHPRKSIQRERRIIGIKNVPSFFPKALGTKSEFGKEPSPGIIQKCEPYESGLCAPKLSERSHEETLHQERFARKAAWGLAKRIYKLKNADKATFYTLNEKGMKGFLDIFSEFYLFCSSCALMLLNHL